MMRTGRRLWTTKLDLTRRGTAIVPWFDRAVLALACTLTQGPALAQTYVTPMMGGGQVAADMDHIDIYYDADANQLHAHVDDSSGTPKLRPLEPGASFDPHQPFATLNGKAYNSQYGWNVGGFFTIPPGTAIWIELIACSPGLETYEGWGRLGSYTPIFGTAGSSRLWQWSGVMIHNTYAIQDSSTDRLYAEYHIYFGDPTTGSRDGFMDLADTTVRLEWTVEPVEDPMTFKFGAVGQTSGAALSFLNAAQFATNSQFVVSLRQTNSRPRALQYEARIPMLVVPATRDHGGPVTNHAALGSCLEFQVAALSGPSQGNLSFWEPGEAQEQFSVPVGAKSTASSFVLSENKGTPNTDPYGDRQGRVFAVDKPGLYCLSFRVVDSSTNGLGGGPIHAPSPLYNFYLQAGLSIAALIRHPTSTTAVFAGQPGRSVYLERTAVLGGSDQWQDVAGPLPGTNYLQKLTDPTPAGNQSFFRLRAE